jgi:formylglycine-generating enzyme required for sulfatase activity
VHERNEEFGSPNGYWCYVRPGTYQIGGWEEGEESADITLPGFWIAKYPVTVAQYRVFVEDGGYQQQEYWTPTGWEWKQKKNHRQPWRWEDMRFNRSNQALIGVSWYEGMAFCAWLTGQLNGMGYEVRLPTEAEWEAAAAYDAQMQRYTYPWGEEEPTPEHAIFEDNQGNTLGAPAPVGVCPAGTAVCGALDMGGNVWEWCHSSYETYPQSANAARTEFNYDEHNVPSRGGSWWNNSTVLYVARGRDLPDSWYDYDLNGFRVVLFLSHIFIADRHEDT